MRKRIYTDNRREMSYYLRSEVGFKCERCGAPERQDGGHTLTTNLLIEGLGTISRANLAVLCRHCQGKVQHISLRNLANQLEMFDHFEMRWLRPHLEGLGILVPGSMVSSN